MAKNTFFLAIDQGTTSSRAIVFDQDLRPVSDSQQEFEQHYPNPGWVEHDPEQIWQTTRSTAMQAVSSLTAGQQTQLSAVGITNQRETTLIWDRQTGKPIYNAIVWQDRRTAKHCEALKKELDASGRSDLISEKTGLLLDPYFSATKIAWILDNVEGARAKAERGELAFGTVDTFLIWRLTEGKVHATDATNASRTSLFNIKTLQWDAELLELFRVPAAILPVVKQCADNYGSTSIASIDKVLPIRGVAGDQQAAAIGQRCFATGDVKSTYGTGCFMLVNTGTHCVRSRHRLLSTIAYQLNGETHYALEGSIFIAGAAVQWLRDGLKVIKHAADTENHAQSLEDNQGVYLVPAFTGLGAPYWDPDARGAMFGLTRATGPAEMSRAALESIAYLSHDLLRAVREEGIALAEIKIDGGMVANSWFAQFLTDMLDVDVIRPTVLETTAVGAAFLAAIGSGSIPPELTPLAAKTEDAATDMPDHGTRFTPTMPKALRTKLLAGWHDSINRTLSRQ